MIPFPTIISTLSLESSFFQSTSFRLPSVTPRRNDPPRKQTRWSCLGTTFHVLLVSSVRHCEEMFWTYCSPVSGCLAGWSSWVNMRLLFLVLPTRCFLIPSMASSYIYESADALPRDNFSSHHGKLVLAYPEWLVCS